MTEAAAGPDPVRNEPEVDTIRSPEDTARIYDEILKVGGMRLMANFVEANAVLSIAGARPQTELYIDKPTEEDHVRIALLANIGVSHSLEIQDCGEFDAASDGRKTLMVSVTNLESLARASRTTGIKDFPEYKVASGSEGARRWAQHASNAIEKAKERGDLPQDTPAAPFFGGIEKGYPLVAIMDACKSYARNKRSSDLSETHILGVDLYGGAYPDFDYAPEHADHPDIVRTVQTWEKVLGDFYGTAWHQALAQHPQFREERAKMEKR